MTAFDKIIRKASLLCEALDDLLRFLVYGLGENTDDPGSRETTSTKDAEGFMWMVSCIDAAFFLVPETKAVSKGILLLMSVPIRKLYSIMVICSLFKIFLNNITENTVDNCVSNTVASPCCYK